MSYQFSTIIITIIVLLLYNQIYHCVSCACFFTATGWYIYSYSEAVTIPFAPLHLPRRVSISAFNPVLLAIDLLLAAFAPALLWFLRCDSTSVESQ
jgi:hypothetical protein